MNLSEITFTDWVSFEEYTTLPDVNRLPGVYLLAHFKNKPSVPAVPELSNIIYIGETTSQTLRNRLQAFYRSAFCAASGHSGGMTYCKQYFNGNPAEDDKPNLYVAIYGVSENPLDLSKAIIKFAERLCILRYVEENERYPHCNSA